VELPAQPLNLESVSALARSASVGLWHEMIRYLTKLAGCPPWLDEHRAGPLNMEVTRGLHSLRNLAPTKKSIESGFEDNTVRVLTHVSPESITCGVTVVNLGVLRFLWNDCSSEIPSSASDTGSNVKKPLSSLWPRWVPCAANTLHLAIKAALGAMGETATARVKRRSELYRSSATRPRIGNPAAADVLERVRKISNHFHKSSDSIDMLHSVPFPGDGEPRQLITESPGRCGSTYSALV